MKILLTDTTEAHKTYLTRDNGNNAAKTGAWLRTVAGNGKMARSDGVKNEIGNSFCIIEYLRPRCMLEKINENTHCTAKFCTTIRAHPYGSSKL